MNALIPNIEFWGGYEVQYKGILASAPSSPHTGWVYTNSGDSNNYFYYNGAWYLMTALVGFLLQENGDYLLQENGDKIFLE